MEELGDVFLEDQEEIREIRKLINKSIRNEELEQKAKEALANLFGTRLSIEKINQILMKNHFKGIYVANNEEYESITDSGGQYFFADKNESSIIIPEKNIDKIDILCHEMVHAIINDRIKPVSKTVNCQSIAMGLEEGICESICTAIRMDKKIFYGNTKTFYITQTKLVQQLNLLYQYTSNRKYSSLMLYALLEPEKIIPLVRDIYSEILDNQFYALDRMPDIEKENLKYKTAYSLLLAASLPEKNFSKEERQKQMNKLVIMSCINHLYYSLCNPESYFEEKDPIILDIFPHKFAPSDYDKFVHVILDSEYRAEKTIIKSIYDHSNDINYYEETNELPVFMEYELAKQKKKSL